MNEVHGWLTSDGKFFPIEQADEASKHQAKLDLARGLTDLDACHEARFFILDHKVQLKAIFDKLEL